MKFFSSKFQTSNSKLKKEPFGLLFVWVWRRPTFPQTSAVSSARRGLTSLFGMGRGGPPCYSHHVCLSSFSRHGLKERAGKNHSRIAFLHSVQHCQQRCRQNLAREVFGLLVALGSTCRHAYTCALSTCSSSTTLK